MDLLGQWFWGERVYICTSPERQDGRSQILLLSYGQTQSHIETCHSPDSSTWKERKPIQTSSSQKWQTFHLEWQVNPWTRKAEDIRLAICSDFSWPGLNDSCASLFLSFCRPHLHYQTNSTGGDFSVASCIAPVERPATIRTLILNSQEKTWLVWPGFSICYLYVAFTNIWHLDYHCDHRLICPSCQKKVAWPEKDFTQDPGNDTDLQLFLKTSCPCLW